MSVCPSCGYCPHCGRPSPYLPQIIWPQTTTYQSQASWGGLNAQTASLGDTYAAQGIGCNSGV